MLHKDRLVDVVDLGPITSPRLPRRVARFAHEVARIKEVCAKEQEEAENRGSRHAETGDTDLLA